MMGGLSDSIKSQAVPLTQTVAVAVSSLLSERIVFSGDWRDGRVKHTNHTASGTGACRCRLLELLTLQHFRLCLAVNGDRFHMSLEKQLCVQVRYYLE